jgi:hypothetical protein
MAAANNNTSGDSRAKQQALTPEMVQKVADKVYALWLRDSQIERERRRPLPRQRKKLR